MYEIFFRPRVFKDLTKRLHPKDRDKIFKKIRLLARDPFDSSLNIKKLSLFDNLEKAYRLRSGQLRVIYELDTKAKKIVIHKIDYRRTTTY